MNINMMIERLNGDGIPNYLYTLDDIDPVDKYYIGKIKGKWEVYYGERGVKIDRHIFTDENDACEYLIYSLNKIAKSMGLYNNR